MSTLETRCLEAFPEWLRTLGQDARDLADLLTLEAPEASRRAAALGLTFLVRTLEFIEEVEEQGFSEAALVLRLAAESVPPAELETDETGALVRLAADAELIREFLGDDYPAFARAMEALSSAAWAGTSVDQLASEPEALAELAKRTREFAEGYTAPAFAREPKSLIKLRAYLRAKTGNTPEASGA